MIVLLAHIYSVQGVCVVLQAQLSGPKTLLQAQKQAHAIKISARKTQELASLKGLFQNIMGILLGRRDYNGQNYIS
mgnify:CR=1 FL=1